VWLGLCFSLPPWGQAAADIGREYHNREVTALTEDAETVRLALGLAWEDGFACRALAGYVVPAGDAPAENDAAETVVREGVRLYERTKCVDDGILSVRLSRDSRNAPRLKQDVAFWRNELALAAADVRTYAETAATRRARLSRRLEAQAVRDGVQAAFIPDKPWSDPQREQWRQASVATGIRLPLPPRPGSMAAWWDRNLSVTPGYLVRKFHAAGESFFTPEEPIGGWGSNATAPGQYDWTRFDGTIRLVKDGGGKFLLELPTLQAHRTPEDIARVGTNAEQTSQWILGFGYAPGLPDYLTHRPEASLVSRSTNGTFAVHGGVQLFDPTTAQAYGEYLKTMAGHLKRERLYDTIAAIHLEMGGWADLPETVDYSSSTRLRWQAYLSERYGEIAAFNRQVDAKYGSFAEVDLPPPPVAARTMTAIDVDYLHFRRAWIREYLAVKRQLVNVAFPDKLVIGETWQAGDHDGFAGAGERKWGAFAGDDWAQWTGTGADNAGRPFAIRSVGPVGFGTRPSDAIESLFRDYLWINFRDPGNLARYFYHWVAHGYMDYQFGWHSIGNLYLSNRLVYRFGATVANTEPAPQRIGLLQPRATYDLGEGDIYYEFMGWDWALQAAKLAYTRIDEQFIRDGRLPTLGLDVLVLPAATALDDKVARAIEAWVTAGGTAIASTVPGVTDEYGRKRETAALAGILGASVAGTTSEAVRDLPLTVTVPHGHYSGRWQTTSDRHPAFQFLRPETARVLASYESGKPAITRNAAGKGQAVTLGYPFGREVVECERTSIGFQRTYVWFTREPQLVARVAWLGRFLRDLGCHPLYEVEYADVGRIKGVEAVAPDYHVPWGLSQDPTNAFFIRTVGDPRPRHELEVDRESPDLAIRFFPRRREGVGTTYLGISTREVHYLGPRATVNMLLARHSYRCRINNPKIRAIWDVGLRAPVGLTRDERGVAFTISLPSGHLMMLAVSETPTVELFRPTPFPGRDRAEIFGKIDRFAGGRQPDRVAILTPDELVPWARELAQLLTASAGAKPRKEVIPISYGAETNREAAERLARFLQDRFGVDAVAVRQLVQMPTGIDQPVGKEYEKAVVLIGDEWTNNDLGLHGAYWGTVFGAHLPFTSTYAWPGVGRAVVSLSRPYALINESGGQPFAYNQSYQIRPVNRNYALVRRKLFIAANGADALAAVDAISKEMERGK
jgi:hypothetical protein